MTRSAPTRRRSARTLRRAAGGFACLILGAVSWTPAYGAPEDPAAARARFVADRDAASLSTALAADASAAGRVDLLLAGLAADPRATQPTAPDATGYAAVPEVVAALHRVDTAAAERAATRATSDATLALGPYVRALTLGATGRDDEAVRALVGRAPGDAADRTFRLALLASALPDEERVLLLALVRRAVVEAARAARPVDARSLAEDALALDRALGVEPLVCACRLLRRAGDPASSRDLLSGAAATGGSPLGLERAVDAFLGGDPTRLEASLRGLRPAPHEETLWTSFSRATRPDAGKLRVPSCPAHVPEERRDAWMVARIATLLGRATDAQELPPALPGSATTRRATALAARGVVVLPLAGDVGACEELLQEGLPILVLVPSRRGKAFVETPVLLVGRARAADLWIADEPDVTRSEVLSSRSLAKSRLLAVAPVARANVLARWRESPSAAVGASLEAAAAAHERSAFDEAFARLSQAPTTGPGAATRDVVQALYSYGRAVNPPSQGGHPAADLRAAAEAVQRSLAVPPPTATEQFLRGESLRLVEGNPVGALAAYEEAERLAGPTPWTQGARFRAHWDVREHSKALRAVDIAWRLDPLDETALYWRGRTKQLMRDTTGARADYRRALARRPASREIALDLAQLEIEARRPRVALEVLDDLCRRDPTCSSNTAVRDARRYAERALLQSAPTVAELVPFRDSPEPDTRQWLAFALATHETAESEAVLRSLLSDAAPSVRVTALRVYMRPWFRSRVEGETGLSDRVVALLQRDPDPLVRGAAAALLSLLPKPFAEEALAARLAGDARDPDPYPRSASAAALARHGGPASRRALVAGLADEDATVRRSAIEALFRITGTYYGYDPDGPAGARAPAVERWRAWLSEPSGG